MNKRMIKGLDIVPRDEYFLKTYDNKKVLSVHALVFTIFCFLVDEIIKLKVLACFFEVAN